MHTLVPPGREQQRGALSCSVAVVVRFVGAVTIRGRWAAGNSWGLTKPINSNAVKRRERNRKELQVVVREGAWDVVWEGALLLGAPTLPTSRQLSVLPILASTALSSLLVKQKNCTENNSSFPGKGGLGKKKSLHEFLFVF